MLNLKILKENFVSIRIGANTNVSVYLIKGRIFNDFKRRKGQTTQVLISDGLEKFEEQKFELEDDLIDNQKNDYNKLIEN